MDDFFISNTIIIIIIIIVIIGINYELKNQGCSGYENSENYDYALTLSDNIINEISMNQNNMNQNHLLQLIINKFMELNIITKNTANGQKLILYLQKHTQKWPNIKNSPASDEQYNILVNNILDKFSILVEIIYPVLIFVKD